GTRPGWFIYACLGIVLAAGARWQLRALRRGMQQAEGVQREDQAEAARRVRAFVQRLIDVIPQPVYVKDAESRYLLVNDSFCRERRRSREELIGRQSWTFAPDPGFAAGIAEEDLRVLAGEAVSKEECIPHMYTGEERFRLITKGACLDAEGRPVIVGANFDVTPWRKAERAVARTRDFLQFVFEAMPNPVLIKDESLRYVTANPAAQALLAANNVVGRRLDEFIDPAQAASIEARERELLEQPDGTRLQTDLTLHMREGEPALHFLTEKVVGRDAEGARVMVVSLTDVSALHAAREREARRRERTQEFIQRLIDMIPEPVYVKDAQSRYLIVNDAFARDFNCPKSEIPGLDSIARVGNRDPDIGDAVRREDLEVLAGTSIRKEDHRPWLLTGGERHRMVSKGACIDADGNPVIVVANFDVTRWYQAESKLKEALEREQQALGRTQEYIQRLIDVIPYPVYVKDAQSRFLLVNDAFARDRQLDKTSLAGDDSVKLSINGPDSRALTRDEDINVLESGRLILKEEYKPHPVTGEERYRVISKASCEDAGGQSVIVVSVFDVTPWRLAERQLAEALSRETARSERIQQYVQRLIDVIPQPVYVKDAGSRYLLVNEAFARDRGLSRDELVGRLSSVRSDIAREVFAEDARVLAGQTVLKEEYRPHPVSGQPRYRVIAKGSCLDDEGHPVIVGANFDVTPWRMAEARLSVAKDEAERANAAKSLFLTNMSHELRTPMHAILSFARLGVERGAGAPPDRLLGYFQRIVGSGERLMALLDGLLDLAKLESGRLEMSLTPQDLGPLVQDVLDEFEALASAASITLTLSCEPACEAPVDGRLFAQVVRNLVSNAIKFSPAGSEVSLQIGPGPTVGEETGRGVPTLEFSVADRGPGIPEDELESVFRTFMQGSHTRHGNGGTGLGLAICREIVGAHHGLIYARNRMGGGAEFVVSLPLR
ncbi:MAG: PAS domain-containing protein, partial [Candidatus Dactylopiibacterium sp.]|nr:PAS domain-containing protein [Candidatus Dactylopiibacterium sp.]